MEFDIANQDDFVKIYFITSIDLVRNCNHYFLYSQSLFNVLFMFCGISLFFTCEKKSCLVLAKNVGENHKICKVDDDQQVILNL